jgi:hypothetical protein
MGRLACCAVISSRANEKPHNTRRALTAAQVLRKYAKPALARESRNAQSSSTVCTVRPLACALLNRRSERSAP